MNELNGEKRIKSLPVITSQVFQQVKDIWPYTKQYQLIIIDAPARTSQGTLEIAKKADLIIQPVGVSRDDLLPALREFNALKAQGINKNKLLFVLNHLSTTAEVSVTQEYLVEGIVETIKELEDKVIDYKQDKLVKDKEEEKIEAEKETLITNEQLFRKTINEFSKQIKIDKEIKKEIKVEFKEKFPTREIIFLLKKKEKQFLVISQEKSNI